MTVVHDITTKICNTCGREISILHPESWAYKRKLGNVNIFWCSWSCLREAEKFLVGLNRIELSTSPLSGVRSNQLSYRPSPYFSFRF